MQKITDTMRAQDTGEVLNILVEYISYGGYDWTMFGIFKDVVTGDIYWGCDSGCSCNSPWDYITMDMLTLVQSDSFSKKTLESGLIEWLKGAHIYYYDAPEQRKAIANAMSIVNKELVKREAQ